MEPGLDFRNTNTLWASVLVETLVRCGVRDAVISPGSRSTPLTVALVRHPQIRATPVVDERSAAYFALGIAKRAHVPVALVCTSGTAGANYFPAIIEARESATPLLVLTADRPPELRDCASGQTIDQQKLFGGYVTFFHELAVPQADLQLLRYVRQTVAHACGRARQPVSGPVHLNVPFRDPLPPVADGTAEALRERIDDEFFAHLAPPVARRVVPLAWQRPTTTRGLIIAGPANPPDAAAYARAVGELARGLGWPILADALSPLRHAGGSDAVVVAHYDAILRDERRAQELTPRYVVCVEGWPTSKVLRAWLERSQAEVVLVGESAANRDALHGRTRHVPLPVEGLVSSREAREADGATPPNEYAQAWREAEAATRARLEQAFAGMDECFEGRASWLLGRHLPEATPVFIASSMPVRDAEYFWPVTARRAEVYFNRGANGIDGTLSTALGIAHAAGRPTVLLTGDLAFLHDSNGLMLASRLQTGASLTIVLINNRGGGIFEHLPIARFEPPFEEFFATPPRVDFASLCAAHDVTHVPVRDWQHFVELISTLPAAGVRVLELQTDRKRDVATRKRMLAGR